MEQIAKNPLTFLCGIKEKKPASVFFLHLEYFLYLCKQLTNQSNYIMDAKKPNWKRILELIAYICTAVASFIGGASLT